MVHGWWLTVYHLYKWSRNHIEVMFPVVKPHYWSGEAQKSRITGDVSLRGRVRPEVEIQEPPFTRLIDSCRSWRHVILFISRPPFPVRSLELVDFRINGKSLKVSLLEMFPSEKLKTWSDGFMLGLQAHVSPESKAGISFPSVEWVGLKVWKRDSAARPSMSWWTAVPPTSQRRRSGNFFFRSVWWSACIVLRAIFSACVC